MRAFLRNLGSWRNLIGLAAAFFAGILVFGCAKGGSTDAAGPKVGSAQGEAKGPDVEAAATPEERLYEQLRSGMFQANAASGSIEEALSSAKDWMGKLKGAEREPFSEVVDLIDSAGSGIAEYADDPPAKDAVAGAFAIWEEKRKKAIDAGNDAMHDLRDAIGTLEGLPDPASKTAAQAAREVRGLILVALDDLYGAVEGFGGKPETEEGESAP